MNKNWWLLKYLGFIVSIFYLSGCGTIITLIDDSKSTHPRYIYSGVRNDVPLLSRSKENPLRNFIPLVALDIPLSACADTIVLPYTIYRTATEPRKILIVCRSREPGTPSFLIRYAVKTEDRRERVSLQELCAILSAVSGKPASVEVLLFLGSNNSFLPIDDFGSIYEAITSNSALVLFYRPARDARNLLEAYLEQKKSVSGHLEK